MSEGVAIVGMAGRFPGAPSIAAFRDLLARGGDAIAELDPSQLAAEGVPEALRTDPNYVPAAAILDGIDLFDAGRFGIPSHEADLMDPQQRILLETARLALHEAGIEPGNGDRSIGIFAGAAISTYLLGHLAPHLLTGPSSAAQLQAMVGNDKDYLATQLAYRLDVTGPVLSVQTACSTSLVAVHLACQSLLAGECDAALAGGVSVRVPQQVGYLHHAEGMLSPTGRCRSYGAEADGTVFGSGCGLVVLRRLDDAVADGDCVRAVIRGSAINNDGARKFGFTAPSQERQAAVIAEALAVARLRPAEIGCIEGHGTGTPLGDPIEVAALTSVFRGLPPGTIGLGSVKSNIGHAETAAGIAALIKAVLMLEEDRLYPTLHSARPNPRLDLGRSPFRLIEACGPWPGPRRVGVSSFGIGGTNAQVVLEPAPLDHVAAARVPHPPPVFERRRHWFLPRRDPGRLLGPGTRTLNGTVVHEAELDAAQLPWLGDHRVDGRSLFPAAGYLAALHELELHHVAQLEVTAPVHVDGPDAIFMRVVIDGARVRFFSRHEDRWQPCAEVQAVQTGMAAPPVPKVAGDRTLTGEEWNGRLRANGLEFGPAFTPVEQVDLAPGAARLRLRPGGALLAAVDAGLQAIGAAFGEDGRYRPTGIERCRLGADLALAAEVIATVDQGAARSVVRGAIWWLDGAGQILAHAEGVTCRAAVGSSPRTDLFGLVWDGRFASETDEVLAEMNRIAAGYAADALARCKGRVTARQRSFAALLDRHARSVDRSAAPCAAADRLALRHPAHAAEVALVRRAGEALGDVLEGRRDPLEVVFGDDGPTGAYAGSPLAAALNGLVADIAAAARPARVIEVGAGTGATTAAVLGRLAHDTDYLFTDIGAGFLAAAAERFGSRPGFATARFDLAAAPDAQGIAPASFDLVIAANVLHALPSLRAAVRNAAGLLRPGGLLVLVEGTRPLAQLDLVFGATEGWWAFADHDLRPEHPLISGERWLSLLAEAGLVASTVVSEAGAQAVLCARRAPAPRVVAVGRDAELARRLGLEWCPMGAALPEGPLDTVVALAGLERQPAEGGLADLLAVVHALGRRHDEPRLIVATRTAEMVRADDGPDPETAALQGFVRTLALEEPGLRARTVDLDDAALPALAAELLLPDGDDRVAWRQGRRYVPRLAAVTQATPAVPVELASDLSLVPQAMPRPGPGEVVVRVRAAGINFKDALIARGAVAGGDRLGGECAGEVVAVGPGVAGLRPGVEVIAVGAGALAHHLRTAADLCVPKPSELSFHAAAALPIAGATAWHALHRLAKLKAGQRVLIHSATGGVGQMALRLAQRLGAEVVATAGTEVRRAWLAGQGVAEVHSSRDLGFAKARPVDVVLNALVGEGRLASLQLLRPGGCFIEIGRVDVMSAAEVARVRPDIRYEVVALDHVQAAAFRPLLAELVEAVAHDPALLPGIRTLPLERAAEAFELMRNREHLGKLVLRPRHPAVIRADGSYLVTGGRGGLGPAIVEWLQQRGAGAVLTLGRRASDDPHAVVGDVADPLALQGVKARIVALGLPPMRGVVHAAGVLADGAVTGLAPSDFAATLRPKPRGARAVVEAFPDLELFLAFSSAGAVLGSPGQAAHTAASAALDAFVAELRANGLAAVSIDWAAWSGIGAAAERGAGARSAALGIGTIARDRALVALDRALAGDLDRLLVLPLDRATLAAAYERALPPLIAGLLREDHRPTVPVDDAAPPADVAPITTVDALRQQVAETCRTLLPPGQALDPRRALSDQGVDSLGALELRTRLGRLIGRRLPTTLLFDHPTLEALVRHLAAEHLGVATVEQRPPQREEGSPVAGIDPGRMSDAELDATLAGFERLLAGGSP